MTVRSWEFWIDVGGTFTDCIALAPEGALRRYKVLSTGVIQGAVGAGSSANRIHDPARAGDPRDVWRGYQVRLRDAEGRIIAEQTVCGFDDENATLELESPLSHEPRPGLTYELTSGEPAPLVAIRYVLGLNRTERIPPIVVRLGTTRGTNALLTRRGARTALVTTRGFGDILRIGNQNRPKLFELNIRKPQPLYETVVEIDERVTFDGQVLTPLDRVSTAEKLNELRASGVESLAICLLHSYAQPAHEIEVAELARAAGFEEISVSHQVAPLIKIVSRGDTTVVDAYLNPVLRSYVNVLREALVDCDLRLMTSAGGLVSAERFIGKDSILSGPAGGVVGFSRVAEAAGFPRSIGFDMGGTSTDVARFDGQFEYQFETEKAGVRIVAAMLAIETVAAGGGSICRFDGVKLVVGPESAGADPGPACYGRGGPLAVTDLNFYLGKIPPERFPLPLDRAAVERRLQALVDEVAAASGKRYTPLELCEGLLQIANANMVQAIRSISIAKGVDPAEYVLVAFGGAGGQHACAIARELGMHRVLDHPDAGLLSAYGIGMAAVTRHRVQGVYRPAKDITADEPAETFSELAREARDEVLAEGIAAERVELRYALDLRYQGQEAALNVAIPTSGKAVQGEFDFTHAFHEAHRRLYGYAYEGRALEVVAARVEAIGTTRDPVMETPATQEKELRPHAVAAAHFGGIQHPIAVYLRDALVPGQRIAGPAIICGRSSTTVIDPGWQGEVLEHGELLLTDEQSSQRQLLSTDVDPVQLEIFNNQFAGIAEQMGITLRNTSSSVNVKERLDFSCALFTAAGELVVNAPHIPVHLGAMGETVRQVIADNPSLEPGDVIVTNDPFGGGSHLPDVTVVTPVHDANGRLQFFTASRAHHAEIGGIRPGSMPPFSRTLAEEGVLIRNVKLIDAGRSREAELAELLRTAPYPSRSVNDNLADIAAQVAANQQGARDLARLVERYSWPVVSAYMRHIQDAAQRKMRLSLNKLPQRPVRFEDHLDDGTPLCVELRVEQDRLRVDFTGTGPVSRGNLNANRAIVTAAVMYCLRTLIDEDIPLNQGVLTAVELVLPEGILNPRAGATAEQCPAVVGGNVETSQRCVDVILGAMGLASASQGTMNNLLFGDKTFGYYETICGGAGAGPGFHGADAVHTHMTNTRLTDPEVLERRYPVRLRQFAIRRGSGGDGQFRGGEGVIRCLEFLRPLQVSILSQRRGPYAPYGLAGGSSGALGRNHCLRSDGTAIELGGQVELEVQAGDRLTIETPGGGGYGAES